ncbi:GyrI-like domain-containing protein [Clostridium sporogenes]|uniref:GyrI-like domain-containing protein n=1 Tax=Clostridium sporogenes TaxID=1509 RepID=UPI002237BA27|nr:GyrI-like domain-containing protein [Clostridium sporogenes]MCW6109100.1 GyrI-like domain-containing protein [Clostridium sporogenes]
MNYDIEIKTMEPIKVASMRYEGPVDKAGKYFPKIFRAIKGKANGAPFICYHKVDQKTGIADLELCIPTSVTPNGKGISLKEIPPTKAVCLTHIGSYDTLMMAYDAIRIYIESNDLAEQVQPPWREVFIKGPGLIFKGDAKKYITEIVFPIKD